MMQLKIASTVFFLFSPLLDGVYRVPSMRILYLDRYVSYRRSTRSILARTFRCSFRMGVEMAREAEAKIRSLQQSQSSSHRSSCT